jgi:AcrR family transcriptional regulator
MQVSEGLRERKKRATRDGIAAAAMRLFRERGFDAVTVADVARAADVSEKTVFNYFATKEDLVFRQRWEERLAELVDRIRRRPAGTSLVQPFRELTAEMLDAVECGPAEEFVAVPRLVAQSKALRDRLFLGWEEEAAVLTPLVAAEAGTANDVSAAVVARTLSWTHRLVFRAALRRLLAGESGARVARELRAEAQRAYDLVEQGLAGYGVRN